MGLFDEQFFAYGEDLDFFKRMDQAGLKYKSTRKVNTFHVINGTASNMPEMARIMDESRDKLKEKYEGKAVETPASPSEPKVWGEEVKSETKDSASYTLDNLPVLIRTNETGDKVFLIKDKMSHWITSPEVLSELGLGFGDVVTLPRELFYQIEMSDRITLENVRDYKHE